MLVSGGAFLCLVWLTIAVEVDVDPAWENIFRTRSDEDWRSVWHTERHRRCYHDLLVHMDWVCQKDIYSVQRRRKRSESVPFVDDRTAHGFLQPRRTMSKRGIIDECCHGDAGCSWEEYAEYCPANSRLRS